jgi:two-component system C4-dicarboxylate transport sensor histidine kinase DctB
MIPLVRCGDKSTEFTQSMNPLKMSFRAAASALALAALMVAYFSYSSTRDEAIRQLDASAERRADRYSLPIFAPTDKYAYLPNLVAAYEVILDTLSNPRDARRIRKANLLLERLNRESGAAAIYLMDLDGMTIAASNWQTEQSYVGNNYGFRPYFVDALREGRGSFYGLGVTTGIPGYFISHAVKKGNKVIGVVVVKVDIRDIAAEWKTEEHEVMVTDGNGVVFLSSREEWKYRPMQALSPATREQLRRTRQYETVLREPLSIAVHRQVGEDEQIISLDQMSGEETERVSYFVKSRALPASDWTVHVLTSMEKIDSEARRSAVLAVGMMVLLLLSSMYFAQRRNRNRERRESARALEDALQALEVKHADLQAVSEELRQASITDPLTGAYNRRFFMETTVKMVSAANRHKFPLSVITVDVDHFKQVNDEYGHPAGDKVLQALAQLYREELRDDDIFARFGGEEFMMALPHTDEETARQVAERLREKMMNLAIDVDGRPLAVTISSGVSQHRLTEKTIQAAIERADEALYEAKNGGRNAVVVR